MVASERTPASTPDEVAKMRTTLKEYESTFGVLVQRLRTEQAAHKKSFQDQQLTIDCLRDEICDKIRDTRHEMAAQRGLEQGLVATLKGENGNLLEKNQRLQQDLAKMVETLEEMRKNVTARDNELMAAQKKHMAERMEDMTRMSQSVNSFGGQQTSGGMMGWLFGHGSASTSRMVFFGGFLLCLIMAYFFQNLNPAQAVNPAESDYDIEMMI